MRTILICLAVIGFTTAVHAQQTTPYAPPDAELWSLMSKALQDLPISFPAHQQVQQILSNVQQEAQRRAKAALPAPAEAK